MTDTPTVLVTGAARRIGAAIARSFHQRGCNVILHYNRSAADASELAASLNAARAGSACCVQADLCDPGAAEALAQETMSAYSRLDVLVNNASSFYPTPFGESTAAQWDELVDSNVRCAYFLSQALGAELRARGGAIVNIIDTHADSALRRFPIYTIAKAGLKAMTRSLALELAPGVRVNGVSPGAILWPPGLEDDSDAGVQAARQAVLAGIPLGRLGEPVEIAQACCFLALDAAYMTGHTVRVDGGRSLV